MAELQRFPVTTSAGATGYVLRRARFIDPSEESRVLLDDGTELVVPSGALEAQSDGSFRLKGEWREPNVSPEPVDIDELPPPDSSPTARQDVVPQFEPGDLLYSDEVGIERVSVNQLVDEAPATRQEGDILIIPVVEEVLVVQKRLLVKEEIRINRRRQQVREPRRIFLNGSEARAIEDRDPRV